MKKIFGIFFSIFLILISLYKWENSLALWYCRSGVVPCEFALGLTDFREAHCTMNPTCSVMGPYPSEAACKSLSPSCPY